MTREEVIHQDDILKMVHKTFLVAKNIPSSDTVLEKLSMLGLISNLRVSGDIYYARITTKGELCLASGGLTKQFDDEKREAYIQEATVKAANRANWIAAGALLVAVAAFFREELFNFFNYVFCLK